VLFLVYPTLGETSAEAREKHRRMVTAPNFIEASLAASGTTSDIDFSQFDIDKPLPCRLTTNGEQGSLDRFQQWGSGKTLRQLASERFDSELDLIGTPDELADKMARAMEEVGGDGFLISTPFQPVDWFIGMVRALGNLIGNCVATVVVAAWEKEIDLRQAERVLDSEVMIEAETA
jgi:alkanesulfonate monooxygenase SsuD/methylene tetrahydromethanopterin reductase-like flavin-dependent oxidoreductase (luciferase family)